MIIQATKLVLMELVITATSFEIIKHIALRNRGINNQILMELVINTTSLYKDGFIMGINTKISSGASIERNSVSSLKAGIVNWY